MSVAFRVVNIAGNWLPADYARLAVIGASIGVFQLRKVREASALGHNLTRLGNDVVWQRSCCGGFAGWDGGLYFCDGGCSDISTFVDIGHTKAGCNIYSCGLI